MISQSVTQKYNVWDVSGIQNLGFNNVWHVSEKKSISFKMKFRYIFGSTFGAFIIDFEMFDFYLKLRFLGCI